MFNRRHLSAALTAIGRESYDARKSYAGWLETCGIVRSFRKLYLGHKASDVTDLYEMADRQGLWLEHGGVLFNLFLQPSIQAESGGIA